jgi:hypothetical protein
LSLKFGLKLLWRRIQGHARKNVGISGNIYLFLGNDNMKSLTKRSALLIVFLCSCALRQNQFSAEGLNKNSRQSNLFANTREKKWSTSTIDSNILFIPTKEEELMSKMLQGIAYKLSLNNLSSRETEGERLEGKVLGAVNSYKKKFRFDSQHIKVIHLNFIYPRESPKIKGYPADFDNIYSPTEDAPKILWLQTRGASSHVRQSTVIGTLTIQTKKNKETQQIIMVFFEMIYDPSVKKWMVSNFNTFTF